MREPETTEKSDATEKKYCPGCGALFQSENEELPGYLPPEKEIAEGTVCKRCFQLKHYAVYKKAPLTDPAIFKKLRERAENAAALFLVIDVTRPEISFHDLDWVESLHKPVFVIANKADLLEEWITRRDILAWLSDLTGVRSDQIILVSAKCHSDMADLRRRIEDSFEKDDRLMFVGSANVGKSTLLAELLRTAGPTVSRLPGTTVGFTEYAMKFGPVLVDAPGLKGMDAFLPVLCSNCLAALSPKKVFQSSVEVLKKGQTISFGGLAQVTVSDAGERGWVRFGIFAPDSVVCHRTNEERIESLLDEHSGELLTPPCTACAEKLRQADWKEEEFQLKPEEDFVVPGIGWVSLYSGAGKVVLRAPAFIHGSVRRWLVPTPVRRHRMGKR